MRRKKIATALASLNAGKQSLGSCGGETELYQASTWKLPQQRVRLGRRGKEERFDRENIHHPDLQNIAKERKRSFSVTVAAHEKQLQNGARFFRLNQTWDVG
jgi:hypothetical protein